MRQTDRHLQTYRDRAEQGQHRHADQYLNRSLRAHPAGRQTRGSPISISITESNHLHFAHSPTHPPNHPSIQGSISTTGIGLFMCFMPFIPFMPFRPCLLCCIGIIEQFGVFAMAGVAPNEGIRAGCWCCRGWPTLPFLVAAVCPLPWYCDGIVLAIVEGGGGTALCPTPTPTPTRALCPPNDVGNCGVTPFTRRW